MSELMRGVLAMMSSRLFLIATLVKMRYKKNKDTLADKSGHF